VQLHHLEQPPARATVSTTRGRERPRRTAYRRRHTQLSAATQST